MRVNDMGYRDALSKVDALKAVGWTSIYLKDDDEKPWELVTSMDSGGVHRIAVSVSVSFTAKHPNGLSFKWFENMEPRHANGSAHYQFDVAHISSIMAKLTGQARKQFCDYLLNTCVEIKKVADEFHGNATSMYGSIEVLRRISAGADQLPKDTTSKPTKKGRR